MAKPKAPEWLREAFRDGVDAYLDEENPTWHRRPSIYPCWLAPHDPAKRECTGRLERFHFIRRQDVETSVGALLPVGGTLCSWCGGHGCNPDAVGDACPACRGSGFAAPIGFDPVPLILLAAWDPRNGAHACEEHHRRFDNHQVSLPRDRVIVPYSALPSRVVQFAFDYSEGRWLDRFPSSI